MSEGDPKEKEMRLLKISEGVGERTVNARTWAILGVTALLVLLLVVWPWSGFNSLVQMDEEINAAWAQVENQLQRRYDLIPNLVETVKGYARHEEAVFKELADARSRYAGAATPQEKMAAAGQLESALGRLLVVVENYPNLKADQRFAQLQDELAGTENRIAVERMRYNQAVRRYNATIRRLPYNILASLFNFQPREYFEATGGAQEAPKVQF